MNPRRAPFCGILLAAGRGRRFDPSGQRDKLQARLPGGAMVAAQAAKNLLLAIPSVLVVLRPGATGLAESLTALGCEVVFCPQADAGMGASLAFAISRRADAEGWLIALADMPHVAVDTMLALSGAIGAGAAIAAPVCQGRRGNPVAFGPMHRDALLACASDQGARHLLARFPVRDVAVDDPGIWRDIDGPEDLLQMPADRC